MIPKDRIIASNGNLLLLSSFKVTESEIESSRVSVLTVIPETTEILTAARHSQTVFSCLNYLLTAWLTL